MDRKTNTTGDETLLEGFSVKEKLGSGSFSSVYRAIDKVKKTEVAIKCIDKSEISKGGADSIVREIKILKMIVHPHIVQMLDFHWDDKYVYIVLEYCNEGDLSKYIKKKLRIPESVCKTFMIQLIEGLKHLRSKGIYHYDLKPQNILLQKKQPSQLTLKISDFGLSLFASTLDDWKKLGIGPRGSPSYMAPEMLLNDHYDPALIDLWSLGVILYECLHGRHPLPHKNVEDLVKAVKEKKTIKVDGSLSDECKSLLRLLLSYNPKGRIAFEQMSKHPFINLEYEPPTDETFYKAVRVEREAVKLDFEKKYHNALNKYCEALKYMAPFVTSSKGNNNESTSNDEESDGSEELMQPVVYEKASSCSCDKEQSEDPSHLTSEQVNILKKIARPTPKMYDGLDFGYTAQMYFFEGNYKEALDRFMLALSVLVPLLPSEPCGKRKELLTIQVKEWLQQAESLKTLLSAHSEIRKIGHARYNEDGI